MNFTTLIGLIVAIGSLVVGYLLDNGNLMALWLLSAFIMVVGGSLGSLTLAYGFKQLKHLPILIFRLFRQPPSTVAKTLDFLVYLSEGARKNGLLSVERLLNEAEARGGVDPLLKRGMMMVIDGADLEQIKELLETELAVFDQKASTEISMFETMAAFAPAYGMIGTIMGLVQVLANMDSPQQMASSIAVAFITTLYGVVIANAFCLPAANKLKLQLREQELEKEMIIEGICSIRNGQNPKLLRDKLSIYLDERASRKKSGAQARDKKRNSL